MTEMAAGAVKPRKKESYTRMVMKRLLTNPTAAIGLVILAIIILVSVFAPFLTKYSPNDIDYTLVYAAPSAAHPFGCDALGRDMLTRLMYGGRYSLTLGFTAALVGAVIGVSIGLVAGYAGGMTDMIVMRIMDVWSSIPGMLLAILISTTMGAGFGNTILAMTVGGIPGGVRGTRAMCLKEREMEYLEAERAQNCSTVRILFKHLMPNVISPTIVGTTMSIGGTIMGAAGLAYIGLGIQPPNPEWGSMLSEGRSVITTHPYVILFPGLCIAATVLCINMFGDGLRDALDPRLKK